jgi:hypothetical protein
MKIEEQSEQNNDLQNVIMQFRAYVNQLQVSQLITGQPINYWSCNLTECPNQLLNNQVDAELVFEGLLR